MEQVFQCLRKHGLVVNGGKCEFGMRRVSYLGHIISNKGVSVDEGKFASMKSWPTPKNLKELRGFLRLTGYYRRFVMGYAQLTKALMNQLKKDSFAWNKEAEKAFQHLKGVMMRVLVLALPNFQKLFFVETDASHGGLGAVLMQDQHPIAYFSKTLGVRASRKLIYEKELMAIVFSISKWKHSLLGRKFLVKTDQNSLKHLLEQWEIVGDYQKWIMKLMGYDFVIEYNPDRLNTVADALSRIPHAVFELGVLLSSNDINWGLLQEEVKRDPTLARIREAVALGEGVPAGYMLENDVLFCKGRYVLAKSSPFIPVLLREYHHSPVGRHAGKLKTYLRLAAEWFWEGMRRQVTRFLQECQICQQAKASYQSPAGLLQNLPIPTQVWEHLTMDFIEGLPRSEGVDTIFFVVDCLTKFAHFLAFKHPLTALTVASRFVKNVVQLHGFPSTIVSDRDKVFYEYILAGNVSIATNRVIKKYSIPSPDRRSK